MTRMCHSNDRQFEKEALTSHTMSVREIRMIEYGNITEILERERLCISYFRVFPYKKRERNLPNRMSQSDYFFVAHPFSAYVP